MEDPNQNQAQQLAQFRKDVTAKLKDEGHTTAMIQALDAKYPGQGPQFLQHCFTTSDPVGRFVAQGMQALAEAAERPRDPRDAQAEASARAAEATYDQMRSAQRDAYRKARGR
jgi:hypothetical protein